MNKFDFMETEVLTDRESIEMKAEVHNLTVYFEKIDGTYYDWDPNFGVIYATDLTELKRIFRENDNENDSEIDYEFLNCSEQQLNILENKCAGSWPHPSDFIEWFESMGYSRYG